MKKTRRHYPSYVTNNIMRAHTAQRDVRGAARVAPIAVALICSVALLTVVILMGTGMVG